MRHPGIFIAAVNAQIVISGVPDLIIVSCGFFFYQFNTYTDLLIFRFQEFTKRFP